MNTSQEILELHAFVRIKNISTHNVEFEFIQIQNMLMQRNPNTQIQAGSWYHTIASAASRQAF